jgi:aryl-alcohol dehydrogenase-like predicted oxidoreductase
MPKSLSKKILGKTGLQVTHLGFGAMEIRGSRIWNGRSITEEQATTILNAVLDAGINFIDTANDYGRSEEFIGKFISHRRNEFYIATKCGCNVTRKDDKMDITDPHIWTKENLLRGLHESLQRMKTDYVDIIQLHNPTVEQCEQGRLVEALQEMKNEGKARYISISTTLPHLPAYLKWNVFDTFQIPYSALEREHEEWITKTAKAGIGTIIRGGVARGEPNMGLGNQDRWQKFEQAKLDELRNENESRTAFLLRYTLSHPDIHTIITGTLIPEHLHENIKTVEKGHLSQEVYLETKRRLDQVGIKPAKAD